MTYDPNDYDINMQEVEKKYLSLPGVMSVDADWDGSSFVISYDNKLFNPKDYPTNHGKYLLDYLNAYEDMKYFQITLADIEKIAADSKDPTVVSYKNIVALRQATIDKYESKKD